MRRWGSLVVSMAISLSALAEVEPAQEAALVSSNDAFAFDLYAKLKSHDGNLFFSPYSISSALAMTAVGAAGETKAEMDKVLHFQANPDSLASAFSLLNKQLTTSESSPDALPQLTIANSLWLQKGFSVLPTFTTLLSKYFLTSVYDADFQANPTQARARINQWVMEKTHEKIKELFPEKSLDSHTRLVVASAITMKAKWASIFEKRDTTTKPFHLTKESTTQTEMMTQTAFYRLFVNKEFALIEIPYATDGEQGPELALLILLPHEIEGLSSIENSWLASHLRQWINLMESQNVQLTLPKFKIEQEISLRDVLRSMGMRKAFDHTADFSGINGRKNLAVDKIFHKAYLSVDEKGTEAAAATGVAIGLKSIRLTKPPYPFLVNHPFLFLIMDKRTGTILFMGRLYRT